VLDTTVQVSPAPSSCREWNDTPASIPSSIAAGPVASSQNPSPYRFDSVGTSLRGCSVCATRAIGTMRPASSAAPQGVHVGNGGVDAAVPAAQDRKVKDVGTWAVHCQVADRRVAGKLVRPEELGR